MFTKKKKFIRNEKEKKKGRTALALFDEKGKGGVKRKGKFVPSYITSGKRKKKKRRKKKRRKREKATGGNEKSPAAPRRRKKAEKEKRGKKKKEKKASMILGGEKGEKGVSHFGTHAEPRKEKRW